MSDDEIPAPQQQIPFAVELPPEAELGVYADFASIWHTQSAFVLDFLAIKTPPSPLVDEAGEVIGAVVPSKVAVRVRVPAEQIAPIVRPLNDQLAAWLAETGRSEPPEGWFRSADHQQP